MIEFPRTVKARRAVVTAVGAAVIVVVTGCGVGHQGEEPATDPTQTQATTADPVAVADVEECFAVADTYLSVTLLPLDTTAAPTHTPPDPDGEQNDDGETASPVTLAVTADSIDDVRGTLPGDVQEPFGDAAEQLRGFDETLTPQELMGLRDTLQPVHVWLNERCSSVSMDWDEEPDQEPDEEPAETTEDAAVGAAE